MQGDHSGCVKPPVDNKSCVLVHGPHTRTGTFVLLSCQREVCHNLNGHHVVCHLHFQHMRNYAMKTKHFQRYYEYKKGVRDTIQ